MATSSTNAENPVNQIASLLGDALQGKEETPDLDTEEQEETLEVTDESQPQEESLAEEVEEESAESSDEEEGIDTLNNLAEELEIDIADMYALNVKLSRGGNLPEGGKITLGELKTFYEKNADIDNLRTEIQTRETELQTKTSELSKVPQVSNELLQARAQVLAIQDAYNRTDWQGLRHSNPAEYSALQNDYRSQFEIAKHSETLATQTVDEHRKQSSKQQQERLLELNPELKDDKIRAETAANVLNYAKKYGFTQADVERIEDHRLMRLLISASKTETAKVTAKAKQEDKTPQSAKASARKPLPGRKAALKRLTDRARSTGQVKDQAAAVAELLRG